MRGISGTDRWMVDGVEMVRVLGLLLLPSATISLGRASDGSLILHNMVSKNILDVMGVVVVVDPPPLLLSHDDTEQDPVITRATTPTEALIVMA